MRTSSSTDVGFFQETSACASLRDELSTQAESSKAEKNERDCAISDLEQRVVELEKERVQLTER